jgi:hypothetical protein
MFHELFANFPVSTLDKNLNLAGLENAENKSASWAKVRHILQTKSDAVVKIQHHRFAVLPSELSAIEKDVYFVILKCLPTDEAVLRISNMIQFGHLSQIASGRTIDTLMTKYAEIRSVHYLLDVGVVPHRIATAESTNTVLFDIGDSYRTNMKTYSKTFFDCFGRGQLVKHRLGSGAEVVISLCKFLFYIWADKYLVFDYLQKHADEIVKIRKIGQRNAYRPKKKRVLSIDEKERASIMEDRRVKTVVCPRGKPPQDSSRPAVFIRSSARYCPYDVTLSNFHQLKPSSWTTR